MHSESENHSGRDAAPREFVGRERELAALVAGLENAFDGRGKTFLLLGDPGIGKSRLADELSELGAKRGVRALWGRCWEGGGAPAFWPWVQVLRAVIRDGSARTPADVLSHLAPQLVALLDESAERLSVPAVADPPDLNSEDARFGLFDAVTTLLRSVAARSPLVIVLDDLHSADVPSVLLFRFITREIRGMSILLVATCRDADARARPEVARVLDEILRDSDHLVLGGLGQREVSRLIEGTFGIRPASTLLPAICRLTEGNPFFVDEVFRLVLAENAGQFPDAAVWSRVRVPERVREVIRRRLVPLSSECRRLLSVAAVIGREFDLRVVEHARGLERATALGLLDEARSRGVVRESPGGFEFIHSLIRELLYEELPAPERVRIHRQIGLVLEALSPHDRDRRLAELAYHFYEAIPAGEVDRAIEYARQAGHQARSILAYEEAVEHYRRASRAAAHREGFREADRCELLLAIGETQWRIRDVSAAGETFSEAAALARRLGDTSLFARSVLGLGGESVRFFWLDFGIANVARIALFREAIAAVGATAESLRARLLSLLAIELHFDARAQEEREELTREAVDLARRVADPNVLVAALRSRALSTTGPAESEQRIAIGDEIVRIAQKSGHPDHAFAGHLIRMRTYLEKSEVANADREIEACDRLVSARHPFYSWWTDVYRAMRAIMKGSFEEGEHIARRALAVYEHLWPEYARQVFMGHLGPILRWRGDLQIIAPNVEELLGRLHERSPNAVARAGFAMICCELGHLEHAQRELNHLSRSDFAYIPRDEHWLAALAFLAEVSVALGDSFRARALRELLSPFADRLSITGPACWGPVSHPLGELSAMLGEKDQAIGHFERALRSSERIDAPPFAVRAETSLARVLTLRDGPGDRARAAKHLTSALAISERLGMKALLAKALDTRRLLESSGEIPDAGGDLEEPSPGSDLTERAVDGIFRREGHFWTIVRGSAVVRLKNMKGLRLLACLLRYPGEDLPAIHLSALAEGTDGARTVSPRPPAGRLGTADAPLSGTDLGDAGEILDGRAKAEYRKRLSELREDLEEAQANNDPGHAERLSKEIDALTRELTGAVGLGGRDRRAASASERARVAITKAIRTAVGAIAEADEELGRHFIHAVKTGKVFSYQPEVDDIIHWSF